jgi:hypothetical protein
MVRRAQAICDLRTRSTFLPRHNCDAQRKLPRRTRLYVLWSGHAKGAAAKTRFEPRTRGPKYLSAVVGPGMRLPSGPFRAFDPLYLRKSAVRLFSPCQFMSIRG